MAEVIWRKGNQAEKEGVECPVCGIPRDESGYCNCNRPWRQMPTQTRQPAAPRERKGKISARERNARETANWLATMIDDPSIVDPYANPPTRKELSSKEVDELRKFWIGQAKTMYRNERDEETRRILREALARHGVAVEEG